MKGKSVWKRMMAMFLSLAMVLTSGVFSSVGVNASWFDPTKEDESDGSAFGLVFRRVWKDNGVWASDEDWSEYRDREYLPGNYYEFTYKQTPDSDPVPVSANDLQIMFYNEAEVVPDEGGHYDPRFFLLEPEKPFGGEDPEEPEEPEEALGRPVDAESIFKDGVFELRPDEEGWYVIFLKDLQKYDPDFEKISDNDADYTYGKTISGDYMNWDDDNPDHIRYVKDTEVMATLHFCNPLVSFVDKTSGWLDNGGDWNIDYQSESPDDLLYLILSDEDNWEPYSDTTDDFDGNDGEFVVEQDGRKTFGTLKDGEKVGDYFTVKALTTPGWYQLIFDPDTRHNEFRIRFNYQNKDNNVWREEANLNIHIKTRPYNAMYPSWVDYEDQGALFMENGAPGEYIKDENGSWVLGQKKLETQIGIDFKGADFWLGYHDVSTDKYMALTDPAKLKVDYYSDRNDYDNGQAAEKTNVAAISESGEANMIHFDPVYERGFYVITYLEDITCPAFVEVSYPGMALYSTKEAARENAIDSDNIKLISGNDVTYDFGVYESYWDEKIQNEVFLDLDSIEVIRKTDEGEQSEDLGFNARLGTFSLSGKYSNFDVADYVEITRSPETVSFNSAEPNWFNVTLKAPEEGSYDVRFYIQRPDRISEYGVHVTVMQDNQICIYSDEFENPEEPIGYRYAFRAINPLGLDFRLTRVTSENGKTVEKKLTEEQLKTFSLFTRFKVSKENGRDEYLDDWLPEDRIEAVDPKFAEMEVLGDGKIRILPKQQSKQWILASDALKYSFEFETVQPGIGFFTSDYRPDVYYGMPEVMNEWTGDCETVYEIPGKKTTKPRAEYLWVWSDPADGYSAVSGNTVLSVKGKESADGYVLSQGEVQFGRNEINTDRINYSGYSVELTDQAAEDYTLVVDTDKYGDNYRWYGDINILEEDYAGWDQGGKDEWNDHFSSGKRIPNWSVLKEVLTSSRVKKYTPSEDGTSMVEVEPTEDMHNLYVFWDRVEDDMLHETYEYEVHVEKFKELKVTANPTKTAYTEGDTFNKAGLKVMAYYEDPAAEPVDVTNYVKLPSAALKTSDKSVMITYEGIGGTLNTSVAVNVTAKQITPATPAVNPTPEGKEVEVASGGSTNSEYKVTESGSSSESGAVVYEGEKTDTATNVTIPDTIKGKDGVVYKVTEIADGAMKGNAKVTNVTIGANVEVIGAGAFEGASNLKNVTAGANVTTIKKNAFNKCAKMTSFKAKGSKITTIGDGAFQGTKKMKIADFSKQKLKKIGKNAFSGSGVTKIKINANALKTVGKGALKNAGNKKKVTVTVYAKSKKIAEKAIKKLKKGKGSSKITFKFKKKK
ncbi:MAG: leucine-rich repeat domain-containing protein [Lachnospiraceae bacterium]|nr:leucine-rich repeat domain-containing protein [Lachnospiraceae bacterium]